MKQRRGGLLLAAAVLALGSAGCGGGGTVYVGVGVVGPYWGYPYPVTTHPGVYGRPPYWDEDLEEDAALDDGRQREAERRAEAPRADAPIGVTSPPGVAADSTQRD